MKYTEVEVDLLLSKICFGCEALGGTDWGNVNIDDIDKAINCSIDLGVNFFDTADIYGLGLSEERLSSILGSRRHDLCVGTKGGVSWNLKDGNRAKTKLNSSPNYIRSAVEASLKRLKLDRIPIYYIHWPDPDVDIGSTFECLWNLQEEGKIGTLGCSNFNAKQIAEAAQIVRLSIVQLPLNVLSGPLSADINTVCHDNDIKVVAYNVLASGLLTGKYHSLSKFNQNDRRSRMPMFIGDEFKKALNRVADIKLVADKLDITVGQYAINWVLSQKHVASAITGIKNEKQILHNLKGLS